MGQFDLPVSPLVGSTLTNYLKLIKQGHISSKFYTRIFLTTLVVLVSSPFHIWEWLFFKFKLRKFRFERPPLFILGHWRSGTTLLHNMLCADPDAGYITTYQSVFPNNIASKLVFKTFMKINIPDERPSDKVKLNVDFPQEDEFAFCNMNHNGYYNFFYFPENYDTFYKRSIGHEGLSNAEKQQWYKDYDLMVKKAVINTKGKRVIVKNPVNTARIKHLLKMYPDAKFLYIYRNPITVFLSTQRFFISLMPTLYLHETDNGFIDNMIFDVYKRLMNDYIDQKNLIPKENLLELKYEDFEKDPVNNLKNIYDTLLNENFEEKKSHFSRYFETIKGHKKNKYKIDATIIEEIKKEFGKYMEIYNFDIPEEIVIKTDKKTVKKDK